MLNIEKIIDEITVVALEMIKDTNMSNITEVCNANTNFDINEKYAVFINFEPNDCPDYGVWFTFYENNDGDGFNIEEQDTADLTEESIRHNLNLLFSYGEVKKCLGL